MKDLESHVKDEYEFGMVYGGEMVDCGEMSREFGTSDFEILRGFLVAAQRVWIISCRWMNVKG